MKVLKDFDISFVGLKDQMHQFEYVIENEFFDFFDFDEFYNTNIKVALSFLKKPTLFELHFEFAGWVELQCDISSELFHQPIDSEMDLVVKFGTEYNDDNDELLVIPHSAHQINVAQYIYESIVLAVPLKRVHPGIADGTLKSEILDKLKEFQIDNNKEINEDKEIDPRWNKLKNIIKEK